MTNLEDTMYSDKHFNSFVFRRRTVDSGSHHLHRKHLFEECLQQVKPVSVSYYVGTCCFKTDLNLTFKSHAPCCHDLVTTSVSIAHCLILILPIHQLFYDILTFFCCCTNWKNMRKQVVVNALCLCTLTWTY